jgi:orotate phosphoribosyltransferase
MNPWSLKELLAVDLFNAGTMQIGAFRLKRHETHPNDPLSPFLLNYRTPDNKKPGPLTPDLITRCAVEMLDVAKDRKIHFDFVAGIPNAGTPFAEAIHRLVGPTNVDLITLEKTELPNRRFISGIKGGGKIIKGRRGLLVDDLVSKADTKFEAVGVLEDAESIIAGIILLVDREQGGRIALERMGYPTHSVYSVRGDLLPIYLNKDLITQQQNDRIISYIEATADKLDIG